LIDLLRNSLEKENQRLPTVISVFLAETVLVVIEPGKLNAVFILLICERLRLVYNYVAHLKGTSLYKPIMSFLLIKPAMDLANVPEFYKLFNSSSLQVSPFRLSYRLYKKKKTLFFMNLKQ
jgi:hypothetical protein